MRRSVTGGLRSIAQSTNRSVSPSLQKVIPKRTKQRTRSPDSDRKWADFLKSIDKQAALPSRKPIPEVKMGPLLLDHAVYFSSAEALMVLDRMATTRKAWGGIPVIDALQRQILFRGVDSLPLRAMEQALSSLSKLHRRIRDPHVVRTDFLEAIAERVRLHINSIPRAQVVQMLCSICWMHRPLQLRRFLVRRLITRLMHDRSAFSDPELKNLCWACAELFKKPDPQQPVGEVREFLGHIEAICLVNLHQMGHFAFAQFASLITERMLADPRWWFSNRTRKMKTQRFRRRAAELFGRGGYIPREDLCESANLLALCGHGNGQNIVHPQMVSIVMAIAEDLRMYAGGVNAREYCEVMADHGISNLGRVYTRLLLRELDLLRPDPAPPDKEVLQSNDVVHGVIEKESQLHLSRHAQVPVPSQIEEEVEKEEVLCISVEPYTFINDKLPEESDGRSSARTLDNDMEEEQALEVDDPVLSAELPEVASQLAADPSKWTTPQEADSLPSKPPSVDEGGLVKEEPSLFSKITTSLSSVWSSMWVPVRDNNAEDLHWSRGVEDQPADEERLPSEPCVIEYQGDLEGKLENVILEQKEDEHMVNEEHEAIEKTERLSSDILSEDGSIGSEEQSSPLNPHVQEKLEGLQVGRPPDTKNNVGGDEALPFFEETIRCRVELALELRDDGGDAIRWTSNWTNSAEKRPSIFLTFCTYGDHDRFGHAEVAAATRVYEDVLGRLSKEQQADIYSAPISGSVHFHVEVTNPCLSCIGVFAQFRRMFPGVRTSVDYDIPEEFKDLVLNLKR